MVRAAGHRALMACRRTRGVIRAHPVLNLAYVGLVGLVGLAIVALGIVLLPAPGPGWAIIFAGLGVLATEFQFARRVLIYIRDKYQEWLAWLGRQNRATQLAISVALVLLVAVCAWSVGAFAIVAGWVGIEWDWLRSPLSDAIL